MDMPVVNLGFSGNGELEEELIGLIAEIDAEVYVLDCFPNLIPGKEFSLSEVYKRIINSVKTLRQKRPKIPVLLVEHAGYGDAATNKNRNKPVLALNKIAKKAFADLKAIGIENIYLLTKDEIGLNTDSYVDGTHPSDYGMLQYASAYEKSIREILNE
jgi:lysophospholipase L1-like esterase